MTWQLMTSTVRSLESVPGSLRDISRPCDAPISLTIAAIDDTQWRYKSEYIRHFMQVQWCRIIGLMILGAGLKT